MNPNRFKDYIARKTQQYGERFDSSELAEQFVHYYNAGQSIRIKVQLPGNEVAWGFVGTTTGWKPVFLLMRSTTAHGSSTILTKDCKILSQKYK